MKPILPFLCLVFCLYLVVPAHGQRKKNKKSQLNKTTNSQSSFDAQKFSTLKWRNIGPFRGGRSNAVSGVRGNPMLYYFGSTGGGVWKTEDAGQSWKNISDGFF